MVQYDPVLHRNKHSHYNEPILKYLTINEIQLFFLGFHDLFTIFLFTFLQFIYIYIS